MVLDVSEVCTFADTLVICHGNSQRQVQTITAAVRDQLRENGQRPHHVEGEREGEWVLLDYLHFVVHVFTAERRQFYSLEHLWGDAPQVEIPAHGTGPRPGA